MSPNDIKFEDLEKAAKFAAELQRQGIRFDGKENPDGSISILMLGH
jgi:hypothetical protein